ncbi:MAG: porphobilinogen synthase [Proteobacteria bacterium]|uniref:Delta-aminolevulinic acid dehydratase n=1 Tax=SAR86 cluster bacterium TaxID=2030880 RepID=A0A937LJ50_9GAMM|nr:porphobilinogen synthase [SAR86 cluster bacterium]MBL6820237.1 porphobilinogen synthase [SAR86 cluster bacterium]MDA0344683.1 porphobilinogen synthase [Pseudomonadota bacterium]MDA0899826.1 porphobilinogen synthase [Pseudomonadota bacterium]
MNSLSRKFPYTRSRRLRSNQTIRDLVSENQIQVNKLIQPLFVSDTNKKNIDIKTMPGQKIFSKPGLFKELETLQKIGIGTVAIFPNLQSIKKNNFGDEALNPENFLCTILEQVKEKFPDLVLIADVALDPYTSSGHDGIVINGRVDNDLTLNSLAEMSLNLANSGADILAPSDMMDGRIGVIRESLEHEGHSNTILLSYAAKYASNFYGPFRDAVGSKQKKGISKRSYQMDYRNSKESLKEIELDINEGADIVMIKPAMVNQDIIKLVSDNYDIPVFAYQVSGEYTMLMNAIDKKIFDHNVIEEALMTLFRSGSASIITYFAKWFAQQYDKNN